MALYETLIEGGHEHLIDAVKARIAQKADAIVEDELKPIIENQPSATLEGELLVADDAADLPPVMVGVDGKSTQDGTPTPDAPVPIVSVDAPVLMLAGKNLLSTDLIERGAIATDQTDKSSQNRCRVAASYNLDALAGNTVTCSGTINGGTLQYALSGYDGGTRVSSSWINSGSSHSIPAGRKKNRILFRRSDDANISPADFSNIQLELGSTATAYEPYAGTTVPLYDGTLRSLPDGTKDTLALTYLRPSTREGWAWYGRELVQMVGHVADMGELAWSYGSTYMGFYAHMTDISTVAITDTVLRCTGYNALPNATIGQIGNMEDKSITQRRTYDAVWVKDADYTDAADFTAAVSGMQLDYPLATPITTQLEPIELPVLPAPTCTVWSDPTANLKLTYVIDSETIEESLESGIGKAFSSVAPVETSPATDSHDAGSRVVYNETLYRVTSAIAAGEDIVPGTNVTATTVAAELLATQA